MRNTAIRYSLAILAALVALFLRHLLTPILGDANPYHTLWLATVFSAWYCGLVPSILSTVLGAAGVWYWFLPPFDSFTIRDRTQMYGLIGFLIFSAALIALGELNRRASAVRSRLAAIVESSGDAIISKTLDGVITSWNKSAEKVFGYTSKEAVGRNITLIIPPDRRNEEAIILERLRRGDRIDHFDTVRVRKDGVKIEVSVTISPLRDSTGRVVGASKVARDITERKRMDEVLKESELSGLLLQVQDQERRRIARELHDGVGQLLAAVGMNSSMVAKEKDKLSPDAAGRVEENSALIREVSAEIRTVSYLLHPPLLDELGLISALKWYVDGFAERSKIAAKLELPQDWKRLPQDYELCLFRIAQECLTNIYRHSGSSTALVRLMRTPHAIVLEVKDEGRGVDHKARARIASGDSDGVGLRGMRERLRQLEGSLEIDSNENGTTVTATVPWTDSGDSPRDSRDILSGGQRLPNTTDAIPSQPPSQTA